MTDLEREFLRRKADGRLPQSTGWAEWKALATRAIDRTDVKQFLVEMDAEVASWKAEPK